MALLKDRLADYLETRLCRRDCATGCYFREDIELLSKFKEGKVSLQPRGGVGWMVRTWKMTERKYQQEGAF